MNAKVLQRIETSIPEEALTHIEMLTELLRDINLEKRMETLIKGESLLKEWKLENGEYKEELKSIRIDLEENLMEVRKMIFMLEQAQYFSEAYN